MSRDVLIPENAYFGFASLDADGETFNANVDGSVTPKHFYVQAENGQQIVIHRMIGFIQDNGNFNAERYGNLATLANGVRIQYGRGYEQRIVYKEYTPVPVKSNAEWGQYCFDARTDDTGSGDNYRAFRWSFNRTGPPHCLNWYSECWIRIVIQDDLTGLIAHRFLFEGNLT